MTMTNDLSQGMSIGTTLGVLSGKNRSIVTEYGDTTGTPHSMSEFYAGGNNVPTGTSGTYGAIPSSSTISMSKFFNSTKVTEVHSSKFTTYVSDGQYLDESGVWATSGTLASSGNNSMQYDDIGTWNGRTDVYIYRLLNLNGTLYLGLKSSGSSTFVNESTADGGFDTLKIYLNQTNGSGTPDLSLARTDALFQSTTNAGDWSWSSVAISTYFGLSSSTTNFFEIV